MISGFVRGDRIPDIVRPKPDGEPCILYDLQVGQPILLLVFDNPAEAHTPEVLRHITASGDAWVNITRIAMLQCSPMQCRQFAEGFASAGVTLLADDGVATMHLLGSAHADKRLITAFAMDANFRVIQRIEYHSGENLAEFMQRLAAVYRDFPQHQPLTMGQQAPVLFIPRVFDAAMCGELIGYFNQVGGQPSGSAYIEGDKAYWRVHPEYKMRRDVYLKEGVWLERIKELLVRRVLPEIKRCFNFQVSQHEVFKLVCYDAQTGGYFRPHRDNESKDTHHRRFAMTLNLNTGDYTGGLLRFPEFGADLYQPGRGDALVFSCSLLHEVTPVTSGSRYALLGFFFSAAESMQNVEYVTSN